MGTIIDRVEIACAGWLPRWGGRHSALHLAVAAAKSCLRAAQRDADDLDLLVNAGIYRDKNLGEPALAALIQEDVGANPEDPHANAHGTFSFDIANGTCGVLTGLQIADGFLRSHTINYALVTASDADPGRGMSRNFPFSPVGAALLCRWTDDDFGMGPVRWVTDPDDGGNFSATVGSENARNVLRFHVAPELDARMAAAAAQAADTCLRDCALTPSDIGLVVAAPARPGFSAALSTRLGVPAERVIVAEDERTHTASLAAALEKALGRVPVEAHILLVTAGAGIIAGAAVYRQPPG